MPRPPSLTIPSRRCSVLTNSSLRRSASAFGGVGDLSQAGRQRRLRAAVGGGLFRELAAQLVGDRLWARRSSCEAGQGRCRRPARRAREAGARARSGRGCSARRPVAPRGSLPAPFRCTCSGSYVCPVTTNIRSYGGGYCFRQQQFPAPAPRNARAPPASAARGSSASTVA